LSDQLLLDEAPWRRLALDSHLTICERVRNGEKLREIAPDYGVTGERIRQVAAAIDPQAGELGRSVRAALKREGAAVLREVRAVQQALRNGPCCVCDGPVTRTTKGSERGKVTCSHDCRRLWQVVRYQLDDGERQVKQRAGARWVLKNSTDPVKRRHAERFLAGTAAYRGRWFTEGSSVRVAMQEVAERRAAVKATGESWWT
jgi:hypothetical protein